MADHMRRNDKLQSLAANAARSNAAAPRNADRPERGGGANRRARHPQHGSRAQQPKKQSLFGFAKDNAMGILSVAGVALLAVLMILFLKGCPSEEKNAEPATNEAYVSPYDWSKLDRTNGRFAYVVDGHVKSKLGVDVSENQHWVDWQAVAADGIDFAMIRLGYRGATEGELYLDSTYQDNINGAKAAGLGCGIYFFSQATNEAEAVEEAEFVLSNLGGMPLEYPVAFDSEVVASLGVTRTADLSNEQMTAIAEAFCKRIQQAGYKTMIYGNSGDLSRYSRDCLEGHAIWWAEYNSPIPNALLTVSMWQYSNGGAVAGIETSVDMNIDLSHVL